MKKLIRTLIVDDSAFVRKVVREMLSRSPYIEVVGAARDGKEALELVEELKPDVVTCDLMMPQMNGIEFVREQMARCPLPILVLSMAPENGKEALDALEAGAVDFVKKPTALASNELLKIRDELIEKVKAVAEVKIDKLLETKVVEPVKIPTPKTSKVGIVVIGISTGGQSKRCDIFFHCCPQIFLCRSPSSCTCRLATPICSRRNSTKSVSWRSSKRRKALRSSPGESSLRRQEDTLGCDVV